MEGGNDMYEIWNRLSDQSKYNVGAWYVEYMYDTLHGTHSK
jgi:hypothetical protein